MNTKTYMKTISDQYGGFHKEVLYSKLGKLVNMAKREEREKNKPPIEKKIKKPISTTNKQVINIKNTKSKYDQIMNLINSSRTLNTWLSIETVPIDLWAEFNAILSVRKDIIFDESRGYTYFRALTESELQK